MPADGATSASIGWVLAPPEPVLSKLEAAVEARRGGALVGPPGVGKTTFAHAITDRCGASFPRVDRVRATASRTQVPFAAFEHLIDVPESGRTADVLQVARDRLGDGRLLLVDDAHLLDPLSAVLLYQVAVAGTATPVVTASEDVGPAEVAALWRDGVVAHIGLRPPGHDDVRLAAQVEAFVAALSSSARRVLEFLTVSDPLSLEDAAELVGAGAVDEAVQSGAVELGEDGLRPAHPLYLDALRGRLGGPEMRRLRTALVDRLSATRPRGVVSRLQLAALCADSDRRQPVPEVRAAAQEALRLGDLELCERLGRSVLDREPDLGARLTVGYALAWQGRGREADAVLDAIDPADLSEDELMAWALPTAANQFWMLSEPERATAFLLSTRNRVSSPAARVTLDALSATFAMNAGNVQRAREVAADVLASPVADDTAIGWAGAAAALTAARSGEFAAVDALAQRAMAAGHPGLLRFTTGFGQTTALVMAGELDRALALTRQLTDFAQMRQPGRSIGELLSAEVLIAAGEPAAAAALLREASAALSPTGYSWGPLAWMLLAQALAQLGEPIEAQKALSRAESRHGLKSMLFAPELALARAWTMAARRDRHGAIAAARDGAKAAERGGQHAVALRVLLDAVRLGDTRAVDAVSRTGAAVPGVVGTLTDAYAQALSAGDAQALRRVSARFAEIGMAGVAGDAERQAFEIGATSP